MSLLVSETGSGLLVAEQSVDERAVSRLLRQHDDSLRLVPQRDEARMCTLWCVYRYMGGDRPALFICAWQTPDGEPLPLSARLLDKVQQLDGRTTGAPPNPDELNRQHRERLAKERRDRHDDIADYFRPHLDRNRVGISVSKEIT